MTTLQPRKPYSQEELRKLYPEGLQLQLVQILLRHGERTPVSSRFQSAGLSSYWPYCNAARQMTSLVMTQEDASEWDDLKWRRRLEIFGSDDGPIVVSGPGNVYDGICHPGELTDKGRETTLALGKRIRYLYVDQLGFMPRLIEDSDTIYIRATPVPRALESVQQAFWGMYPKHARTADFPPPTIITRSPGDETLFPNEGSCRRFAELARKFAARTEERWNDSDDVKYLTKKLGKWMPDQQPVAVDSRPRMSGINDTIASTLAHGPATRLPGEFYEEKVVDIVDKIQVEEWFQGYKESNEYRMLGIGGLAGDIVSRMVGSLEQSGKNGIVEVGGEHGHPGKSRGGENKIKFALSGCHDTTIAGVLSSLGCFDGEKWPPYTSHMAFELFRGKTISPVAADMNLQAGSSSVSAANNGSWWSRLVGSSQRGFSGPGGIGRRHIPELSPEEKQSLHGYYVRIRYNDKVMQVPACKAEGKHLDGDESFCTLEAFKSVVDKFTPKDWKAACISNLGNTAFPEEPEPAGY